MSCTLRRVESVQDFGDRFVSLMEKCHLDASDEGYKQLFTLKLKPHNVYLWTAVLQFKVANPYCTILELVSVAAEHASALGLYVQDRQPHSQSKPQQKPRSDHPRTTQLYSFHQTHGGHSTEQCRARMAATKATTPGSAPTATRLPPRTPSSQRTGAPAGTKDLSKVDCFKCHQFGHYANHCTNGTTINLAEIDEGHAGFDEDEFSALMNEPLVNDAASDTTVRMVHASETSPAAPVPPIEVPVVCAGRHLLAQVDTGASHTILSKHVADELSVDCESIKPIQLAHAQMRCEGWRLRVAVQLECNGRSVHSCLRVMELGPASDLLLGRDHLAALGIGVTKLPFTTTAATAATAPLPAEDEADYVPPRVFGSTPDYDKYRDKVLRLLDAEITANQDIPLGTFYNGPGSEVHIITLEGKRCYRLQYPLPHAVKPAVTKQAQEWLAAGIIGPAPPGCDWNSPLTHSYKKLPDGRKIDIRTCFDARGVNVILVVVDKHPLPDQGDAHRLQGQTLCISAGPQVVVPPIYGCAV
ncbi:hypothetical protein PR001_g21277 [Phytophthora rubi]|uniref:CCHC-type domain-containing protein n=1 Tax=Phytophthora rubi TaxID=129364 RepID=A0A6A3JC38_9STRA|nr:hypothetical protein PR001_g21277 [Phytophthora rubi]